MCTISPKLVETGRHPNIEVMTDTEVLEVNGQAGNFKVQVRHKPRYVDPEQCVACGDCVDVCPIIVPDEFNEGSEPSAERFISCIRRLCPMPTRSKNAVLPPAGMPVRPDSVPRAISP